MFEKRAQNSHQSQIGEPHSLSWRQWLRRGNSCTTLAKVHSTASRGPLMDASTFRGLDGFGVSVAAQPLNTTSEASSSAFVAPRLPLVTPLFVLRILPVSLYAGSPKANTSSPVGRNKARNWMSSWDAARRAESPSRNGAKKTRTMPSGKTRCWTLSPCDLQCNSFGCPLKTLPFFSRGRRGGQHHL